MTEKDLGDSDHRFILQNHNKGEWFFIGDRPASIYSIENISKNGDLNMYNALDPESKVLVQISMAMRKPTSAAKEGEEEAAKRKSMHHMQRSLRACLCSSH